MTSDRYIEQPLSKDDFDGNIVYGGKTFQESTGRADVIEDIVGGVWGSKFFKGESSTRSVKTEFFETISFCPCCNTSDIKHKLTVPSGLSIFQCNACSYGFQNPRLKADLVSTVYEEDYVMNSVYESPVAKHLDTIKYQYGIQVASRYLPEITSVLDVGCGTGLSLDVYSSCGISSVSGIDPSPYASQGIDSRITSSFLLDIPPQFCDLSLITLWDVLEHIHDHKRMLQSVFRALKPGGACLVMVPNFLSLATRLMRERSPVFQIDHIHYFSHDSLVYEFNEVGFQVVHSDTVISEIDNCRNYLEFSEPYFSSPSNESAFNWLTPSYIHDNLLGSRLFFIARKPS